MSEVCLILFLSVILTWPSNQDSANFAVACSNLDGLISTVGTFFAVQTSAAYALHPPFHTEFLSGWIMVASLWEQSVQNINGKENLKPSVA